MPTQQQQMKNEAKKMKPNNGPDVQLPCIQQEEDHDATQNVLKTMPAMP